VEGVAKETGNEALSPSLCAVSLIILVHGVLSLVGVTYKTVFGLDDWIYCTLYI
jgi:hypothetical protein